MQAITLKPWGSWLPWAWPRDGHRETLEGAGIALARQYRDHGLKMLGSHAQFKDGSVSVEAGLSSRLVQCIRSIGRSSPRRRSM